MKDHLDAPARDQDTHPSTPPDTQTRSTESIRVGDPDPLQDKVHRIFLRTEKFVIYSVRRAPTGADRPDKIDDQTGDEHHSWLRTYFQDDYEDAKVLRGKLICISADLAYVCDLVDSICRAGNLDDKGVISLRTRATEMMARAMEMALEDRAEEARQLLGHLKIHVRTLRDSKNRMRYVEANLGALILVLVIWAILRTGADLVPGLTLPTVGGTIPVQVIDILALGALGSFFAVSASIQNVRVNHSVSWREMLYTGAVRVLIGVIAAAVVTLLISGGWLLGSIDSGLLGWSYLLFGFLAGFSELFVPNALKQVESSSTVGVPTTPTTPEAEAPSPAASGQARG